MFLNGFTRSLRFPGVTFNKEQDVWIEGRKRYVYDGRCYTHYLFRMQSDFTVN